MSRLVQVFETKLVFGRDVEMESEHRLFGRCGAMPLAVSVFVSVKYRTHTFRRTGAEQGD